MDEYEVGWKGQEHHTIWGSVPYHVQASVGQVI